MSFLSTFTCHTGHHISLKSNNECSLGSGKGRQITSLHKNRRRNVKKFCCFWKTVERKNFIFFCCFWKHREKKILLFLEKRWRKKMVYFFCRSKLYHRIKVCDTLYFSSGVDENQSRCALYSNRNQ